MKWLRLLKEPAFWISGPMGCIEALIFAVLWEVFVK